MVFENPNRTDGLCLDPDAMALPGLGPFAITHNAAAAAAATTTLEEEEEEDPSKRIRKPYTITKSRQSWTEPEHDKFLEALQLFDRDWKKIEAFIGSKTVIQIRSHAQKYFLKVQKNGTNEHLPPPRPKRKAAHPYPQKASKNRSFQTPFHLIEAGYALRPDSSSMPVNSITSAVSSWTNILPTVDLSNQIKGTMGSTQNMPKTKPINKTAEQRNHGHPLRVLPDFVQVYSFIGSVFDPNTTGHLQKLKNMDPIDVETVLLLMRNLSINLTSPDFEDHRRLLSSYAIDTGDGWCDSRMTS